MIAKNVSTDIDFSIQPKEQWEFFTLQKDSYDKTEKELY